MDDSPLGRLPPEVRNKIYEPLLQQKHKTIFFSEPKDGETVISGLNIPAIVKVCRQIRHETLPYFYNLNKLVHEFQLFYKKPATDLVHALRLFGTKQVKAISNLKFNVYDMVPYRNVWIKHFVWTFAQAAILGLSLKAIKLDAARGNLFPASRGRKDLLQRWMQALVEFSHGLGMEGIESIETTTERYVEWQFEGDGRVYTDDENWNFYIMRRNRGPAARQLS